ncbi:hypothetical protein CesoFtcFv8_000979 [Champsocephalus esox]|uniref:Uncharacterized protein n=1 Tax=Champsocephalus esox TaxID=159716 RepID=A0AAN8D2K9_9TELE|nr:hypothetical protein CesoFtcFv8_000979 [Champsocephalus esox]
MASELESRALAGRDPVTTRHAGTDSRALPSWGSRLDLTMVSPALSSSWIMRRTKRRTPWRSSCPNQMNKKRTPSCHRPRLQSLERGLLSRVTAHQLRPV